MKTIIILLTALLLISCEEEMPDKTSTVIFQDTLKTTVPEFMHGTYIQIADAKGNIPAQKGIITITKNSIKIGEKEYKTEEYYYSFCRIHIGKIEISDFVRQLGMIHLYEDEEYKGTYQLPNLKLREDGNN